MARCLTEQLDDAFAITFVAPFMVTVKGALILREQVGLHKWIAVTLGFIGTVIVIRPKIGCRAPRSGFTAHRGHRICITPNSIADVSVVRVFGTKSSLN